MNILSKRAEAITPSATLAINATARELIAAGEDVVGFGVGEPDFDTPENIRLAAIAAINRGLTRYTAAGGITELKKAVQDKFRRDNGLEYDLDEIVINVGAKHSLHNAFQVLCDPGDEVILPAPYWVSYLEQIKLAGARPVILETTEETGLKVTPQMLAEALSDKTKAVLINSPSNPTGAVYTADELKELIAVLKSHSCFVISDEVYEPFVYDGASHVSIASLDEEIKTRTIVINAVSKAYAMTGWRIGYAAGDSRLIKKIAALQSHSTSNPASIAQYAALEALQGPQDSVQMMVAEFDRRRRYMVERLAGIPGITCPKPAGAFYVFPRVAGLFDRKYEDRMIKDSYSLAEILLEESKVAVVPGVAFGADQFIRLSYAASMERIEKGVDRIRSFCEKLA